MYYELLSKFAEVVDDYGQGELAQDLSMEDYEPVRIPYKRVLVWG